jgi:hypothetical protein
LIVFVHLVSARDGGIAWKKRLKTEGWVYFQGGYLSRFALFAEQTDFSKLMRIRFKGRVCGRAMACMGNVL